MGEKVSESFTHVYGNKWFKTNHFLHFNHERNMVGIYFEKNGEHIFCNAIETDLLESGQIESIPLRVIEGFDFMRINNQGKSRVEFSEFRYISEDRFQKVLRRRRKHRNREKIREWLQYHGVKV